jgi:hypothetical protein
MMMLFYSYFSQHVRRHGESGTRDSSPLLADAIINLTAFLAWSHVGLVAPALSEMDESSMC